MPSAVLSWDEVRRRRSVIDHFGSENRYLRVLLSLARGAAQPEGDARFAADAACAAGKHVCYCNKIVFQLRNGNGIKIPHGSLCGAVFFMLSLFGGIAHKGEIKRRNHIECQQ